MPSVNYDILIAGTNEFDLSQSGLFMEISEQSFTALWVSRSGEKVFRVVRYPNAFPEAPLQAAQLKDIFSADPFFSKTIPVSGVMYNYAECQLFPAAVYSIELNKPLTELTAGQLEKGLILSEKVKDRDIYTIYKVPRGVHELLQQSFTAGHYWHLYTLMLLQPPGLNGRDCCFQLVFYPEKIVVGLFREGEILFLQTYRYDQPEDLSWFLLTLCRQFSVAPADVHLALSGVVDAASSTYAELEKYFPNRSFDQLHPGTEWEFDKEGFPGHFFSNILKMPLCV